MHSRRAWKPGNQALLTLQCYVSRPLRKSILSQRMLGFLGQQFEFRFCSVAICKCCQFSKSWLGSRKWEFWMELKKKKIQGVCWTTIRERLLTSCCEILEMKFFSSLMLKKFRNQLSWKLSWTPSHKWSPLFNMQWTWTRLNFPLQKGLP